MNPSQVERAEDLLCSNTTNMSFISKQADGAEKVRKDLERALMAREDAIEQLENKHKVGTTEAQLAKFWGKLEIGKFGGKLGNSNKKKYILVDET